MATTQQGRLLAIKSPAFDEDYLLLQSMVVNESLSSLYEIEIELLHEEEEVAFEPTIVEPEKMLGSEASILVKSDDEVSREFNGIINRFSQGIRDVRYTYYNATIVPQVWRLTQRIQSRIFQQKSVPEILRTVFEGFSVKYELQRTYEPRNYCVQYRESDFDFASRLMEEEGIFYFFKHLDGKEELVVADTPQSHQPFAEKNEIPFFVKVGEQENFVGTVNHFVAGFRLQTGKVTLWDHNFQLPGKKLESQKTTVFGQYNDTKNFEHYDFPAGYARKYDGIATGGAEQASDLNKVFPDRDMTVGNWMEQIDAGVEVSNGRGDCCAFVAGSKFTLQNHPNESQDGQYVITTIQHSATQNPDYTSDRTADDPYTNEFECIRIGSGKPAFRPERVTPKPFIYGSQTAFVVGPSGEEIFVDKYGRVKVQFHWDREGKMDGGSSCWVRVSQSWAGNNWGGMFIPRIGMEVLVQFLEGDPDQPIIMGCVYNPIAMPPYTLPDEKTKSTIKSSSSKGSGFNEFRFEDKKGSEQVFIHGERDLDVRIKNDRREWTGNDQHLIVVRDQIEKIERDQHLEVVRHQQHKVGGDQHLKVTGSQNIEVTGSRSIKVNGGAGTQVTGNRSEEAGGNMTFKGTNVVVEATAAITLKVGGNFVSITPAGVAIQGTMVLINSGGAPVPGTPVGVTPPTAPLEPKKADDAQPGTLPKLQADSDRSKQEKTGKEDETKTAWITICMVNEAGEPVRGEAYKIVDPAGRTHSGSTNSDGKATVKGIDPGSCQIRFPRLDKEAWKDK